VELIPGVDSLRVFTFFRVAIVTVGFTSACFQTSGRAPAREVPNHVLTAANAASPVDAEQGDFVEIRLDPAWHLVRITGDARIEKQRESVVRGKRVFHFRALGIGRAELAFAADAQRQISFHITVR
jgi:hypothetical protein